MGNNPEWFESARRALAGGLLAAVVLSSGAWAEGVRPQCKIWIQGDSTLHTYTSTATQVEVSLDPETAASSPEILKEKVLGGKMAKLELTMPVLGMKSKEGQLDKNMYKTLKAQEYPEIAFSLARYEVQAGEGGGITVLAEGKLKIAGAERDIKLQARGKTGAEGIALAGEHRLLMTDYKIDPPKLMMGMLKVADPVMVHYELFVPWSEAGKGK